MAVVDTVQSLLGLDHPPIAIGFFDTVPKNIPLYAGGPQPAGCAFWKLAREGRSFVTRPQDHYGCAVGSHTHNIPLPHERAGELMDTVGFMVNQGYLKPEEVPHIPSMPKTPAYVAYAPAEQAAFTPDVVIVAAKPAQAMLLYEAALRAGAGGMIASSLGRPGCAVIPLAVQTGQSAFSFGCRGNRTFTGLGDDELYLSVPGAQWGAVRNALGEIVHANRAMGSYYEGKLGTS